MTMCSHSQIWTVAPSRLLCPWDSPYKITGVGYHAFLQGISPAQGLNPGLCIAADSLPSEPPGKPQDYLRLSSICRGSPSVSPENLRSWGKAHAAHGFLLLPCGFKSSVLCWDQRLGFMICLPCTSVVMRNQYRCPRSVESVFTFRQLGLYFTSALLLFSLSMLLFLCMTVKL